MFEDAMMESNGNIHTRSKYYTCFGALLNGSLLGGLILFPLLHPEALPKNAMASMLVAPAPPPPPPLSPLVHTVQTARQPSIATEFNAPGRIPKQINMGRDTSQPPVADIGMRSMGDPPGTPVDLLGTIGTGTPAVVKALTPTKVIISQGVMAGNAVFKPQPTYPAIAKAARIQGLVILSATISKTGTIENLTVVSDPQMLVQAALEAVRNWRYHPYLLNNEPVEVQTLVNVTFTLGG